MHPLFAIVAAHSPNAWGVPQGAQAGAMGQLGAPPVYFGPQPGPYYPSGLAGGLSASDRALAKSLSWRTLQAFLWEMENVPAEAPEVTNKILGTDDGRWMLGALVALCMTAANNEPIFAQIRSYVHDNAWEWWAAQTGAVQEPTPQPKPTQPPSP